MINYVLAPSILAADFKVLGQEMKKTEDNGAEYIHFDVMDGMFVPSISFGMPVMASIHDATEQFMDAHLMVQEPIRYVEAFQKAGADSVTVHVEACEDVKATLNKIRECGMKAIFLPSLLIPDSMNLHLIFPLSSLLRIFLCLLS